MKKFIITIGLLLSAVMANAQFEIGANMGATISYTNQNMGYYSYSHLGAFYPELQAGYNFNKYLSADLGLGFLTAGFNEQPQGEDEQSVKLRYFSIPFYANVKYPLTDKFSLGVLAGFHYNFINHISADYPFYSDFKRLRNTFGLLAGAKAEYKLTNQIGLNVQYRINPDFYDADRDDRVGRLNYHSILVGFTYLLKEDKSASKSVEIETQMVDNLY